jgi:hypothetical protein
MKRLCVSSVLALGLWLAWVVPAFAKHSDSKETKTGDTAFAVYEGSQGWPTGKGAFVDREQSIPIFIGLPDKNYRVLGRIYDTRTDGLDVVGRGFDEAFGKERRRMRNCANQARLHGADAVVVTDDERVINAFNLSGKELRESAPLFNHRHSIVLAVKLE